MRNSRLLFLALACMFSFRANAQLSYLDENYDMREVCQGTNKKNDRQYYLDRERLTGDMHGQAPVLWCATALLSY